MKTLSKTFNIIKSKAEKKLSLSQKTKTTAAKIDNNAVNVPTGINIIPQSKENLHKTPILASINNGSVSEQMLNDELKAKIAAGADLPEVTAEDNGDVLTVVNGAWDKATPPSPSAMHDYSTNEHAVGTWIDGKPVYEITIIDNTGGSSGDDKTIDITALNIGQVVEFNGFLNIGTAYLPINFYMNDTSITYSFVDSTKIFYRMKGSDWNYNEAVFTLRYTKTTGTEA